MTYPIKIYISVNNNIKIDTVTPRHWKKLKKLYPLFPQTSSLIIAKSKEKTPQSHIPIKKQLIPIK